MLGNPSLSIDYYDKVLKVERRNKQALEERELSKIVLEALSTASLAMEKKQFKKVGWLCVSSTMSLGVWQKSIHGIT